LGDRAGVGQWGCSSVKVAENDQQAALSLSTVTHIFARFHQSQRRHRIIIQTRTRCRSTPGRGIPAPPFPYK